MIFDTVQRMLVEHLLKAPLIDEVQHTQKSSKIEDIVRETRVADDRQRVFQAFKMQKGVSSYWLLAATVVLDDFIFLLHCR